MCNSPAVPDNNESFGISNLAAREDAGTPSQSRKSPQSHFCNSLYLVQPEAEQPDDFCAESAPPFGCYTASPPFEIGLLCQVNDIAPRQGCPIHSISRIKKHFMRERISASSLARTTDYVYGLAVRICASRRR